MFIKKLRNSFFEKIYKFISAEEYLKESPKEIAKFYTKDDEIAIYKLLNACVYAGGGNRTLIFNSQSEILYESASTPELKMHIMPKKFINFSQCEEVNLKRAINLALCWNDNFWHFAFECLDKIQILEELGFDGVYIVFDTSFIKTFLNILKITPERVVFVKPKTIYNIEELIVFESISCDKNFKTAKYLNKISQKIVSNLNFLPQNYPSKIYVKRLGTRKIKNQDELLYLLDKYGFKTIVPEELPLEEQIKYFYSADVVITPHGANSTNSIFMRPDTHFIECFGQKYNNPCCLSVIKEKKINYHMLSELSNFSHSKFKRKRNSWLDDFEVNLLLLDTILDKIESEK